MRGLRPGIAWEDEGLKPGLSDVPRNRSRRCKSAFSGRATGP